MATIGDNRAPDYTLELTRDEAQFLLRNCNSNIRLGLAALSSMNKKGAEDMIALLESFKAIRVKLMKQGVTDD